MIAEAPPTTLKSRAIAHPANECLGVPQKLPASPPIMGTACFGYLALLLGMGGFVTWAALAPLSSAAVAPGIVAVDTNRKVVQHLEGGIVGELLVREGDHIAAGQVLMRLDDLEAKSTHELLEGEYVALTAQQARLVAERDEHDELRFGPELTDLRQRLDVAEVLEGQQRIFDAGRIALQGQVDAIGQRIAQAHARISALEAQLRAGREQLAYIREEAADVQELLKAGLERKPRLLALERQAAKIRGEQGELNGRIAESRESIAEAELEILNSRRSRVEKAALELRDIARRRSEVAERLAAAKVKLARRDVIAPEAGTVFNLQQHTLGGVISPGATILEIVPEDRLMIEARISPADMDIVHPGLPAKIALTAFKARTTPHLDGVVDQVSADAMTDARTGQLYFSARILIDAVELGRVQGGKLVPGMPAEAYIATGERTMLDYLVQPVSDSFRKAFREN